MSQAVQEQAALDVPAFEEQVSVRAPSVWKTLIHSTEGRIGLTLGVLVLVVILFGRFIAPYSPTELGTGSTNTGPSSEHWFGTDNLGRDVYSRVLVGGGTVLLVPALAVALSFVIGGIPGVYGGYKGGRLDAIIARTFDLLLTLPPLLLVLVLISGLGNSTPVLVLSVAVIFMPRVGRVMRGAAQGVVTNDYVSAALARGERTSYILFREVLPNIAPIGIADAALRLTYAIIFVATLNFLGLGVQPPSSDWGLMVAESRGLLSVAPVTVLAPAIGIALLSISFNLIADAVTRHLAPESGGEAAPL